MKTVAMTMDLIGPGDSKLLLGCVSADTEEEATEGARGILDTPELVEWLWRIDGQ